MVTAAPKPVESPSPAVTITPQIPPTKDTMAESADRRAVLATSTPAAPAPTATEAISPASTPVAPVPPAAPAESTAGLESDWASELRRAGIRTGVWETDFSKRSVPYSEIFSGGVPRDGIPPIDNPRFVTVEAADQWLESQEPVVSFELDGEATAYPLQILTWHEIVNDTVADVPVAVTFCPLCNSALVFDRRLNGMVYDFGVSGNLRNSDLIMWDRQTQSWWQQLTGEAIAGELTGQQLPILSAAIVAWQDFKAAYPDARVLSRDTGHSRNYGSNPYVGYDEVGQSPFLFFGQKDERLLPMERVAAFTIGEVAVAYPFTFLEAQRAVHDTVGGQDLVVFFKPGARSALDSYQIADSREVGSTGVFLRSLDGQSLTFRTAGEGFVDQETASRWNIFGQATSGPLAGRQLTPVVHANHFWFAWAAFRPDTEVVR